MVEANENAAYPDENPLVFYSNPGQLQELACIATIASVWYRQMDTNHADITPEKLIDVDYSEFARLPSVLKQMIKELIPAVERSFKRWLYFHHLNVFSYRNTDALVFNLMAFISWRADGTISYEQTAKKMIESDMLSDTEKYRIACLYCFVDDVKKLWPMETAADHPLIQYWNYRMSGKPCEIPLDPGCSCIEASLLKHIDADTRSGFEYLWGFLTDEERVTTVIQISNRYSSYGPQVFLTDALCKLNERQLEHTVNRCADIIFRSMVRNWRDLLIQFWSRVKKMVRNDHFYTIIRAFVWWDLRCIEERGGSAFQGYNFAFEMWISAPSALKNYILDNHLREILNLLLGFLKNESHRLPFQDIRFLIELLSSTSQANRDRFWKENWREILRISPKRTQQIMKLCLRSDDEIALFKTSQLISQIEEYCLKMVNGGNFSDLSDFLELCFDDPVVVFTHRVSVLKSKELLVHFINNCCFPPLEKWNTFEAFLKETFPDTNELNEFKRNLIFGEESMAYFRSLQHSWHFRSLALFVDHVLSSMPELLSLAKNRFLELSRDFLILGELRYVSRIDDWNNFIKWCVDNDDSAVENFKLSLPVEQIFNASFEKCSALAKNFGRTNLFDGMEWLKWVFPTQKALQNFKLGRLGAHEDIPQIRSVFESNDVELIDNVLMWFFNDDKVQVGEFKVSLNRAMFLKLKQRSTTKSLNVTLYRLRQEEFPEASSSRAKLRKRKKRYQTDNSEVSSYRAKLRKRKTASK
ncbi:uncharacterized protein LOC135845405 [Planococcus citri]|uniref:uncharacterized protein LOC135845405 n=1 Tax=Planococcus citri TaxID=170843 RepID=UPI0031F90771